MKDLRLI